MHLDGFFHVRGEFIMRKKFTRRPKHDIKDYLGKKINHLKPIAVSEIRAKDGSVQWVFKCDCGNEVVLPAFAVISGNNTSCGCAKANMYKGKETIDRYNGYIGKRSGHLEVVGFEIYPDKRPPMLKCKCDCGNLKLVLLGTFNHGKLLSCGCGISATKHGYHKHKLYSILQGMKDRCYNKNNSNYHRYGGRGIKVCDEWRFHPEKFIEWSFSNGYIDGLSIDRIDNDWDYCPENCRWADRLTQSRNRSTNVMIEFGGKKMCLTDWSKELGMKKDTLRGRFRMGWDIERAFTEPVHKKSTFEEL